MQLISPERRCLQLFKVFVEKAFIPQIKQANGSLAEWNIFESLISAPNINVNQIQYFVDSLSPSLGPKSQKITLSKKQQQIEQIAKQIFQLNKTFGGEKKRNSVTTLIEQNNSHIRRQSAYDDSLRPQKTEKSSGIVSGLERMLKSFEQNQAIIQNMLIQPEASNIRNSRSALHQLSHNGIANSNFPQIFTPHGYIASISQSKPLASGYLRTTSN